MTGREESVGASCAKWAVPLGASQIDLMKGLQKPSRRQLVDWSYNVSPIFSLWLWLAWLPVHTQWITLGGFNGDNGFVALILSSVCTFHFPHPLWEKASNPVFLIRYHCITMGSWTTDLSVHLVHVRTWSNLSVSSTDNSKEAKADSLHLADWKQKLSGQK